MEKALIGRDPNKVTWLNIEGFKDIAVFEKIGELFGIDKLVPEDILDIDTRPKFEEFDQYSFTSVKMLYIEKGTLAYFFTSR